MGMPIPGLPFVDTVARNNIVRFGRKHRAASPFKLPQGFVNSSLSALSPAELAGLGIAVGVPAAVAGGIYAANALQPGDTTLLPPINEDGTYGQSGTEYRVRLYNNASLTSQCWTGSFSIFGPVSPSIYTFPNGTLKAWQFDGFNSSGSPLNRGGPATVSSCTWTDEGDQKFFKVFLNGDPAEIAIPVNPGSTEPRPVTLPVVPEFPGAVDPRTLQEEFDDSEERQNGIAGLIENVTETLTEVEEFLEDKLSCDLCNILSSEQFEQGLFRNFVSDAIEEFNRKLLFNISVALDTAGCGEDPNVTTIEGDTFQEFVSLAVGGLDLTTLVKEEVCDLSEQSCAVPEEWLIRKAPFSPTLVLRMRESSQGHTGTPKPRDLSIPLYSGNGLSDFPTWRRGDFRCSVHSSDGYSIVVYADTQANARSTADALADLSTTFQERRYLESHQPGIVVNKVELTPFKTFWFPDGRKTGTEPARICNIEKGVCFP